MANISAAGRSRIMRGVRSRDTRLELDLRSALRAQGITGYRVHTTLPGKPDICFTRWRVAVFVDGCFWHACPTCSLTPATNGSYWGPKLERNRERDLRVTRQLEEGGYVVVRLWEHDLRADMASCVALVRDALEERRRRLQPVPNDEGLVAADHLHDDQRHLAPVE